jgi:soluble lytic murein transglycosylase
VAGIAIGLMVAVWPIAPASADALSAEDAVLLRKALQAVDDNKRTADEKFGPRINDPLARKILHWAALVRPDPTNGFAQIAQFMAENPDWPDQNGLRRRAEEAMTPQTPDADVLAWFAKHGPMTGDGKARLGEALIATGRDADGQAMIRDAWINGDFAKRREIAFYSRHRRQLTSDDHQRRLDRLLWEGRYWPAHRMMWKVPADYRALAQARLSLRRREGNVDSLIAKVPAELKNDPGLIYERLRWRRKNSKYDSALELLQSPPDFLVRPERWWSERAVLARRLLAAGDVTVAYRIANNHGLKPEHGSAFAEAEWLAGWVALRFLNEPSTALGHFVHFYKGVNFPVSLARGAYWAARALETMGEAKLAENWFKQAAEFPTTYYGQLAIARMNPGGSLKLPPEPPVTEDDRKSFDAHELVRAVRMLGQIGDQDRLRPFIVRLDDIATTPGWRVLTAELAKKSDRLDLSVLVAKRAKRDGVKMSSTAFPAEVPSPMRVNDGMPRVETPLILAVVRQESAFNVKAHSHANALGLMQLIPHTALKMAKSLNIPFDRRRLVTDPRYNLTLGQAYLAELLDEFKGSYLLSLAAYNAGPHRAKRWIKNNGDPRDKDVDVVDWVELIPFTETRNYVQRVLENLQVYRAQLAKEEVALGLEQDLRK